jgi:catechol 2,3-dioxygenase-like lactoylglutathione lyase family enzyme
MKADRFGLLHAVARGLCPCAYALSHEKGEPDMAHITWDHVHLRTPDPEAMAEWFERILGAEVIRSVEQGKPRVDLKLGGNKIFIAGASPDDLNPAPKIPYRGLDHIGLFVTDLDVFVEEIKAKGAEFTKEPHSPRPGIKICFLRGPEGISVELLERDPKYT